MKHSIQHLFHLVQSVAIARSTLATVCSGVYAIVLTSHSSGLRLLKEAKAICRYLDGITNKISFSYLGFLVTSNISTSVMHASGIYRKLINNTTA